MGITWIFHRFKTSSRTMALGSTQPLTEIGRRMSAGGKGGRHIGMTILPPTCAHRLEILIASTSWGPKGLPGPVYIYFLPGQYMYEVDTNGLRL